jgi:glycosyltransferase involved in cell wall biosynthesis
MNIGVFYRDFLSGGGLPRDAREMVKDLSKLANVFVYYYSPQTSSTTTQGNLTLKGFHVPLGMRTRNFLYCPNELRTILATNGDKLDVVILYGSFIMENVPVATLLQKASIPYIFFPHEGFSSLTFVGRRALLKGIYETLFERSIVNRALGIRLLSQLQHDEFAVRGYDLTQKSFILSEAIDWGKINSELKSSQPYYLEPTPDDDLTFGYLGRFLMYKKGLDVLLKAWGIYKGRGGKGQLKLVGPDSGGDLDKLKELARSLHLTDIQFLPPLDGDPKYRYLSELSALVHPSRHEGIPRVLRESMACGCPIITTTHTNADELLVKSGLVAKLEPNDLADKLEMFANLTLQGRITMKHETLKTAELLRWDRITKQFVEEIQKLLTPHSKNQQHSWSHQRVTL